MKLVKRGLMVLYLNDEEYKKLVEKYEKLKEALYDFCEGDCEDCPLGHYIGGGIQKCEIQSWFDPKKNLKERVK